jgi:hypothetical protein
MIRICPFKEKEGGEGRSQLSGQWKEREKVPMFGGQWKEREKVPMFGGQWKEREKVPMLGGYWKVKEKHLFTSFHFPPKKFYLNLHFFL